MREHRLSVCSVLAAKSCRKCAVHIVRAFAPALHSAREWASSDEGRQDASPPALGTDVGVALASTRTVRFRDAAEAVHESHTEGNSDVKDRSKSARSCRRSGAAVAALAAATLVLATVTPALAATAVDVQANRPQVAGQPSSDTTARFPTNKQNEPTVAVDPASSHLIAGSNDEQEQPVCGAAVRGGDPTDCSFFPGVGTDGVYTSEIGRAHV